MGPLLSSMIDAELGRLLDALDAAGLADDTLVIFTSDHGDLAGGHCGMNDKGFIYEECHRVPLIFRWPGRFPAGVRRSDYDHTPRGRSTTIVRGAGSSAP